MELTADEMQSEIFAGYGILHIEGYLVQNHSLIEAALKVAKSEGLLVSIDMASFNIVEANIDFLNRVIREYVDIVFANEDEAIALTGKQPEEALHAISEMCDLAIVKLGAQGSLIKYGKNVIRIEAIPAKSVDTTGAGDIYASGVLFGISENLDLEKAGKLGSLLAGKVVEVVGAKIPEETWQELSVQIEQIKSGN
jgi:sugar/nucleoside kinase (ribokinase family)